MLTQTHDYIVIDPKDKVVLEGPFICLKRLTPENITTEYVGWLNDRSINQYLESRWTHHTLESVQQFVEDMNVSENNLLFGIFAKDGTHIGNIKLGNVHSTHHHAEVGLMIGNPNYWGKGVATEAIQLLGQYAFECLKLNKLIAGMYAPNVGSYKAFLKAGWQSVGIRKAHCWFENHYVDVHEVELLNPVRYRD